MLMPTSSQVSADADDDVPRVRPQRLPEDREVVRDEDHRDRDGDHVVQHLRPGGPERDELVERVAREARRAARLRVADGALGVGRGGRREDQAADDEDERREPERDAGRQAERVVDRRADVAVGGREERGRAEDALEAVALSPAPGHGADATSRAVRDAAEDHVRLEEQAALDRERPRGRAGGGRPGVDPLRQHDVHGRRRVGGQPADVGEDRVAEPAGRAARRRRACPSSASSQSRVAEVHGAQLVDARGPRAYSTARARRASGVAREHADDEAVGHVPLGRAAPT